MGALKQAMIKEAESHEADVARLVAAARAWLRVNGPTQALLYACARGLIPCDEALEPFSPPKPVPSGGAQWATDREYREHVEATTVSAAEWRRWASLRARVDQRTPPSGGQWATDREYREHVEATTVSAAEWRRWASLRARKEVG